MALNKERALKLADHIDSIPEARFLMGDWGVPVDDNDEPIYIEVDDETDEVLNGTACGTACCVAGWASVLFDDKFARLIDVAGDDANEIAGVWEDYDPRHAERMLGIFEPGSQSPPLFYFGEWPLTYQRMENIRAAAAQLLRDMANDAVIWTEADTARYAYVIDPPHPYEAFWLQFVPAEVVS